MRNPPEGLVIRAMEEGDVDGLVELANQLNFRRFTLRLPFTNRATIAAWLPGDDRNRFQLVTDLDSRVVAPPRWFGARAGGCMRGASGWACTTSSRGAASARRCWLG